MNRLENLYTHPSWQENFRDLQKWEADRVFCRHTLEHFLDVARIAYIEDLEKGLGIPKVLIYAAALLHDMGRVRQYRDGTPHEEAGRALAEEILPAAGFDPMEQMQILAAISAHRDREAGSRENLSGLLYRADKASRMCRFCPAQRQCNWDAEKKNMTITI